jgi:FkbM family methyltransferase
MVCRTQLCCITGALGNQPFQCLLVLNGTSRILYEADADAIDGIREATKDLKSQVIIVPACLAEADCQKTLHVSMNPGCTSLLEPATAWNGKYVHLMGIDFDFPDGARVIERRQVSARSMDSLLASPTNSYPDPDFLSLDVQGYEYEILQGARSTLQRSVCGLIVETEFTKLYAGQKRFQDICDFLGDLGFAFVRFSTLANYLDRELRRLRSSGYQTWADALFLRKRTETGIASPYPYTKAMLFAVVLICDLAVQCFDFFIESSPCNPLPGIKQITTILELSLMLMSGATKCSRRCFQITPAAQNFTIFSRIRSERVAKLLDNLQEFGENTWSIGRNAKEEDTEFEAVLRRFDFVALPNASELVRRDQSTKIQSMLSRRML